MEQNSNTVLKRRGGKHSLRLWPLTTNYAVTGDPTSNMRSYKKIGDRVMKITVKKDGKVTVTGRVVVSADGKSRTVTTGETGAEGKTPKTGQYTTNNKREDAQFYSRPHGALIRVYDAAGTVTEMHEHKGDFKEFV